MVGGETLYRLLEKLSTPSRILVVHPHMDVVGGSEVLTSLLIERIKGYVDVCLLTAGVHPLHKPRLNGVEIVHLDRPRSASRSEAIARVFDGVGRALAECEPESLLLMIQEPVYIAVAKSLRPSIPSGIYIHFPLEEEAEKDRLSAFYSMLRFPNEYIGFYGIADARMTNSAYTASALKALTGLDSSIVYPAVPEEYFSMPEPKPGDKEPLIVSVGRLVPQKGFHKLLEAFSKVREKYKVNLTIIGVEDPRFKDYRETLEERAREIGDVDLIVKPMKPVEIAEVLRRALIYVHLRVGEHFGMSPVEAMSQATVPVVPRQSGVSELIINGLNGFLLGDDNPSSVAKLLEDLLAKGVEGLWNTAVRARRTSMFFHPDRYALQVLSHLKLAGAGAWLATGFP